MYAGGVEMDMYIAMSVRVASRWMCSGSFIILMLSRYNTYDNDTILQYTYMYSILHGRFSCATA